MIIACTRDTVLSTQQIRHLNLHLFHGFDGLGRRFWSPGCRVSICSLDSVHFPSLNCIEPFLVVYSSSLAQYFLPWQQYFSGSKRSSFR